MDDNENQEQPFDLGAILAHVGNIPTQQSLEAEDVELPEVCLHARKQ